MFHQFPLLLFKGSIWKSPAGFPVPISRIKSIAFLSMQKGMDPTPLRIQHFLCNIVRGFPIAL